jgi:TetR/AcrR family transcriptional repressor of mexJK operon
LAGDTSADRGRGRPTDLAKRDAILDAARAQLLTKGFERTTMESVAAAASVSKVTIFNHFRDKASLLEATVEHEAERLEGAAFADDTGDRDPLTELARSGEALLELLANPEVLALDRLLGVEPYKGSDLARRYFAAGPKRARGILARLIVEAAEQGAVQADDPQQAAEDLLALWLGATWREEIALGLRKRPGVKQIRARVRRGLDRFLRMYGAGVHDPT